MSKFYMKIGQARIWAERRRYSNQTYTWLHAVIPDVGSLSLGDPWPCIRPKKAEVETALTSALARWLTGEEL